MARRKSLLQEASRPDTAPLRREYRRVWGTVQRGSAHPFGPDRPFPDFESWCAGRAALVDSLDTFGLHTEDFDEGDDY